ncbi:Uncharacterised protein [Mycobacteroides abscessus subsp. abscessus]|nr:Uncharacterised protein [Mycobacteroides abscessus subsp. abscessus]SLD07786.1 Uncharacterised protein [Mycobacteroides abscessus subsp. massiliense]
MPLERCTVTCSSQVNEVAVSATAISTIEVPSASVGRRSRVHSDAEVGETRG